MSYDYISRAYGIQPIIGEPVRLHNYPVGKVAPEDRSQSHYVMVRFEGWRRDAPIHPGDLQATRAASGIEGSAQDAEERLDPEGESPTPQGDAR